MKRFILQSEEELGHSGIPIPFNKICILLMDHSSLVPASDGRRKRALGNDSVPNFFYPSLSLSCSLSFSLSLSLTATAQQSGRTDEPFQSNAGVKTRHVSIGRGIQRVFEAQEILSLRRDWMKTTNPKKWSLLDTSPRVCRDSGDSYLHSAYAFFAFTADLPHTLTYLAQYC